MNYRFHEGINFLRLRGTRSENIAKHAAILKDVIRKGVLPQLALKNEYLIRNAPGIFQNRLVQDSTVFAYRKLLVPALAFADKEALEMVSSLAKTSGLDYSTCREAVFQPDGMMVLTKLSFGNLKMNSSCLPACTSGVALKETTERGRVLFARNLDYPIIGQWEENPTVVFEEPTEKGGIPFVYVTTAGLPTAGLTSVNAAGLALSVHAHFGRNISLFGRLVFDLGDEIIRYCDSISKALDFLRRTRRHGNWGMILASSRENRAVVVEMTPDQTRVREAENGSIAHSNYFHSPELQSEEAHLSGGYIQDNHARYLSFKQFFEKNRGRVDERLLAYQLGSQIDPYTETERVVGNTVGVITNVQSIIIDPEEQILWLSKRNSSPVALGPFLKIDLNRFWKQSEEHVELAGYKVQTSGLLDAKRLYREAYKVLQIPRANSSLIAYKFIVQALEACSTDAHLWILRGLLELHIKKFEQALESFREAVKFPLAKHSENVRAIYEARALDLLFRREEAKVLYKKFATIEDFKLRKAYETGVRRPYTIKDIQNFSFDLQFADTYNY